jgi:hypothetical protein
MAVIEYEYRFNWAFLSSRIIGAALLMIVL